MLRTRNFAMQGIEKTRFSTCMVVSARQALDSSQLSRHAQVMSEVLIMRKHTPHHQLRYPEAESLLLHLPRSCATAAHRCGASAADSQPRSPARRSPRSSSICRSSSCTKRPPPCTASPAPPNPRSSSWTPIAGEHANSCCRRCCKPEGPGSPSSRTEVTRMLSGLTATRFSCTKRSGSAGAAAAAAAGATAAAAACAAATASAAAAWAAA